MRLNKAAASKLCEDKKEPNGKRFICFFEITYVKKTCLSYEEYMKAEA